VKTADEASGRAPGDSQAPSGELVLGRYRLVRRLGAGGFGVVWLAHDEKLDRAVAVKRIEVHDDAVAARAEREAKAAARLGHPGIVALYETARDDDAVYLVSELVRGRTLGELLEDGALSDADVLRLGVALCDALAHAHRRGVVHRDVKPGNVVIPAGGEHDGRVKLTDFGVARTLDDDALTRTGDVVGTLAYMAPEQADGRGAGAEADLYALGLVLFEALSGINPVRGRGAAATARRVGARLPALGRLRRDLALELCRAIDRAVLPRPEQRGTLAELRGALRAALPAAGGDPGTVVAGRLAELAPPAARPPVRPGARALAALAAGALTAAGLTWLAADPPLAPLAGAAGAALAVALLPRLGWLAAAAALAVCCADGVAVLVLAVALPTALLLRRADTLWSAPAGAPLLGAIGLAAAWPALAGQARRPWHRLALGALGFWWLALAEVASGARLGLGLPPGAGRAGAAALATLVTSGALAVAAVWGAAALALPAFVRGRRLAVDVVGATAWAALAGSSAQAVAGLLTWRDGPPSVRGLVAGAVLAGGAAVVLRALRGEARGRSAP
jgi:hypothetical protein